MPSLQYETIFNSFLGNVTDYDIQINLSVSDSYELMKETLHKSLADPYVRRLFSSLELDDDINTMIYELVRQKDEDADKEFIITALGKWMVYEWLHKQVRSVDLTSQVFAGKEQKFYSQSAHLAELRGLQDDAFKEARFFIQNSGFVSNPYLDGGV